MEIFKNNENWKNNELKVEVTALESSSWKLRRVIDEREKLFRIE